MGIERALWAVGLLLAATAAAAGPGSGAVRIDADGRLRLYTSHAVAPGESVLFQYPSGSAANSAVRCCKRLPAHSLQPVEEESVASDELGGRPVQVYSVELPASQRPAQAFIGAAVIGAGLKAADQRGGRLLVKSGRASYIVTRCTSAEGVHVVAKDRRRGRTVGHTYLGLGYDVEDSTCRH
ncbi:hypothetical protein [Caldimonas brevitalea]|uniref:Uncharacterized protein n=1 Tax=Caldimonas brevitalea TaxID=413882 RepID=A0A0G3BJ94_9BURK|nr:hypothetical protein [Caldimonas brevitalea]AKJ27441.1 hypothetical protein AAW51_0750 [Caldimonas brevitalea]